MSEPPKDGPHVEYYENGQKQSETHSKNGKLVSASVWKPDGEPCSITKIVDGLGIGVTYHENGQKKYEGHFKNDKQDGLTTHWYENGQKKEEVHFKDGKQDGLSTAWDENGQKEYEAHFKDGEKAYFKDGKIVVRPLESPIAKIVPHAMWYLIFIGFFGILCFFMGENAFKVFFSNGKGNALSFLLSLSFYTCVVIYSITVVTDKLQSGLTFFSWLKALDGFGLFWPLTGTSATLLVPIGFFIGGHTFATSVGVSCLLGLFLAIWLLPTMVAIAADHPQLVPLAIVNFFLGASVIGWAACLAWAFWKFDKSNSD